MDFKGEGKLVLARVQQLSSRYYRWAGRVRRWPLRWGARLLPLYVASVLVYAVHDDSIRHTSAIVIDSPANPENINADDLQIAIAANAPTVEAAAIVMQFNSDSLQLQLWPLVCNETYVNNNREEGRDALAIAFQLNNGIDEVNARDIASAFYVVAQQKRRCD